MRHAARFLLACLASAWLAHAAPAGETLPPETVEVPAGRFVSGSSEAEREAAYRLDEAAYGHSVTREQRWYAGEAERKTLDVPAYRIMRVPVTNAQYAAFIRDTGHRYPQVGPREWQGYGLIHPYKRTLRHQWRSERPPEGRADHPVVLVAHADARAYARWLSDKTRQSWRLPSEAEWEKAARGTQGNRFPWGEAFDPDRLNSHDGGPFDTMPVGSFASGASPFGMLDAAGQVYEWTATPAGEGRHIVKGGSWDDKGCGVCRPAARHARPDTLKHILIGFRLVREQPAP